MRIWRRSEEQTGAALGGLLLLAALSGWEAEVVKAPNRAESGTRAGTYSHGDCNQRERERSRPQ
jgi:hypothetical protein